MNNTATAVAHDLDLGAIAPAALPATRPTGGNVLNPQSLIDMVMSKGGEPDLGQLERLLNLQRQWQESEREQQRYQDEREQRLRAEAARLAFTRAFADFTGESIVVPKTKLVQQRAKGGGVGPQFTQSEFHIVSKLLKPALARHGFGVSYDVKFGAFGPPDDSGNPKAWCRVTATLEHCDGHSKTLELEGPPDDSGAKNPLQEMQSSASFLMRHALLAITGTAQGGADNDGRGARGDDDDAAAEPTEDDKRLLQAGRDASMSGLEKLNAWWQGLTEPQRTRLTPEFGTLRTAARKADAAPGARS